MGTSAIFSIDAEQREAALSAATWLAAFYPRLDIAVTDDAIELRSDSDSEEELAAIWAGALASELLLTYGRDARQAAFEALVR